MANEKIRGGIWSYNGLFQLIDSWMESDGSRRVLKFKLEVWKRDGGKCAVCGATDELHFDHIIPFSKGGTSLRAENIQLLCARHNLEKRDNIV